MARTVARFGDEEPQRLPIASWPAFRTAALRLATLSPDKRVTDQQLGLSSSSGKQVLAALRALGLILRSGNPAFSVRRFADGDFAPVTDALRERFPDLLDAVAGPVEELQRRLDALDGTASSKDRFWRFVREAHAEVGVELPPLASRPSPRSNRRATPPPQASTPSTSNATARALLEREGETYLEALDRALAAGSLEHAERISAHLRLLRDELNGPTSS